MIQRKRLAAALLSLTMAFAAVYPAVPSFAAAWERNANGSYVAADGSALTGITARGIDVSHWKQSINWNAVAADDVQFVMLGTKYNNEVDPYFSVNAVNAFNAGLKVGAYIYSYATTTAAAEAEADFVLNLIKDYPISYPSLTTSTQPAGSRLFFTIWFLADWVGSHTTFAPSFKATSTALGLMPPTTLFKVMLPNMVKLLVFPWTISLWRLHR